MCRVARRSPANGPRAGVALPRCPNSSHFYMSLRQFAEGAHEGALTTAQPAPISNSVPANTTPVITSTMLV